MPEADGRPVGEITTSTQSRRWAAEVGALAGLGLLAGIKLWSLITPWPGPDEFLGGDFGLGVEPYFYHLLKRGTIPLWDPTLGTGAPFFGAGTHHPMYVQAHLHLLYPLNLLWLGLAEQSYFIPHAILQYHHVFHYILAGAFTYAYGRTLGLTPFPALFSGIAFMLSGFMLGHVAHWTFIDTIVWLPLVLACLVRADTTERLRWGALAGLFLGIAYLAGMPQILYYMALATGALGLTLLVRRVVARRPWRRVSLALVLVPAVALGIAAVQLIPSWEAGVGSARAGYDYAWKVNGSLPPSFLLFQLLLPEGLQSVEAWRNYMSEFYAYAGLFPLMFAGYAVARRWEWRIGFHAALGLAALLLVFGATYPLYPLAFRLLPGLRLFRIPARALCLVNLSIAILAGLGVESLLSPVRPHGLRQFLHGAVILAGVSAVAVVGVFLGHQPGPSEDTLRSLADQVVILLVFLALGLLVVTWQCRGRSPIAVRGGLLVGLCLDLLFSSSVTGGAPNPDPLSPADARLVEVLRGQPGPFRLSRGMAIPPRLIYRYGWGVVDDESTFAPQPFLDLYKLREENPRILDLLNVKYLVEERVPRIPATTGLGVTLWPGALRLIRVPGVSTVRQIDLDSQLVYSMRVPQGTVVGTLHAIGTDGSIHSFPLRAGIETAEWSLDNPADAPAHRKAPLARSWPVPEQGYEGHAYRATFSLSPGIPLAQLILERHDGDGVLVVEAVRLDGHGLATPRHRFRSLADGFYENADALPRAFLVRRARAVRRAQLMDQLRSLDPLEEMLLAEPLPQGWRPSGALPLSPPSPVTIGEYAPEYVRLEAASSDPVFLVLSDTYDPGWQAWDNGQPTRILRVDHALRAVALAPGPHVVEFRYRQPTFWIGVGISLLTVSGLALGGAATVLRRPRA